MFHNKFIMKKFLYENFVCKLGETAKENWSLLDKCIIMVVVRDVQTVLIQDVENLNTTIIFLLF